MNHNNICWGYPSKDHQRITANSQHLVVCMCYGASGIRESLGAMAISGLFFEIQN